MFLVGVLKAGENLPDSGGVREDDLESIVGPRGPTETVTALDQEVLGIPSVQLGEARQGFLDAGEQGAGEVLAAEPAPLLFSGFFQDICFTRNRDRWRLTCRPVFVPSLILTGFSSDTGVQERTPANLMISSG